MTRLGPARLTALIAYAPNAPTSGLMWPRPCCISMRATPPGRCHRHPLPTATLAGATSSGYGLPFPRMCNGQLFDNRSLRRVLPDVGAAGHGLAVGVGVLDDDIDAVHGPPLVGEALRFISATHHRDIDRDKRANGNESPRGIDIAGEGRLSPRPGDRGSSGADVEGNRQMKVPRVVTPIEEFSPRRVYQDPARERRKGAAPSGCRRAAGPDRPIVAGSKAAEIGAPVVPAGTSPEPGPPSPPQLQGPPPWRDPRNLQPWQCRRVSEPKPWTKSARWTDSYLPRSCGSPMGSGSTDKLTMLVSRTRRRHDGLILPQVLAG